MLTPTPAPPYYAVIFTSVRTDENTGYAQVAERMLDLARTMPGFLGVDSVHDGIGITVSYWESLDAIKTWRNHPEHQRAMQLGKDKWYLAFSTRVCKVERDNVFFSSSGN